NATIVSTSFAVGAAAPRRRTRAVSGTLSTCLLQSWYDREKTTGARRGTPRRVAGWLVAGVVAGVGGGLLGHRRRRLRGAGSVRALRGGLLAGEAAERLQAELGELLGADAVVLLDR